VVLSTKPPDTTRLLLLFVACKEVEEVVLLVELPPPALPTSGSIDSCLTATGVVAAAGADAASSRVTLLLSPSSLSLLHFCDADGKSDLTRCVTRAKAHREIYAQQKGKKTHTREEIKEAQGMTIERRGGGRACVRCRGSNTLVVSILWVVGGSVSEKGSYPWSEI
jgi:hypothetical protein